MYAHVTAPHGKLAPTVREVKALGLPVDSQNRVMMNREQARQLSPVIHQLFRRGVLVSETTSVSRRYRREGVAHRYTTRNDSRLRLNYDDILRLAPVHILEKASQRPQYDDLTWGVYRIGPAAAAEELMRRGQSTRGATLAGSRLPDILAKVGPSGEQNQADEVRYFATWDDQPTRHRKNVATVDTVDINSDCSAALITRHIYTLYHNSLRSSTVECYLVVRDATSGDRHVMRVPPRFGSRNSKTRQQLLIKGGPAAVIHAATAWTFNLKPEEYQPQIAA